MTDFLAELRQRLTQATTAPRYIQLADAIEAAINQQRLQAGDFLPAERLLAQQLAVSRVTVSKALAVLEQKRLILRQQGVGTRVAMHIDYSLDKDQGFTALLEHQGRVVSNQWLLRTLTTASASVAAALELAEHQPVAKLRRLRLLDGLPVSLETTWIAERFLPDPQKLENSLYRLWQSRGIVPARTHFLLNAISCDDETALLLNMPRGAPLLRIQQTTRNPSGEVLEWSETLCRGDIYAFEVNSRC